MVPLPMVVRDELVEGAEEPTLPEEDQAVETAFLDCAYEDAAATGALRGAGEISTTAGRSERLAADRLKLSQGGPRRRVRRLF